MDSWLQLSTFSLLRLLRFPLSCIFFTKLTFFFLLCWPLTISLDTHLHWSVLSCQLRSSDYSLFLSYSFSFYNDTSLRLGRALLGLCTFPDPYINLRTSCNPSLTLTYSILPWIYQGHWFFAPGFLLVSIVLLSWHSSETFETLASVLTLESLKEDPLDELSSIEFMLVPTRAKCNTRHLTCFCLNQFNQVLPNGARCGTIRLWCAQMYTSVIFILWWVIVLISGSGLPTLELCLNSFLYDGHLCLGLFHMMLCLA